MFHRFANQMSLKVKNTEQQSEDYLRFGILEFEKGHIDSSWEYVSQALQMDSAIGEKKHAYESYINRIIRKYFGPRVSIADILNNYQSWYIFLLKRVNHFF